MQSILSGARLVFMKNMRNKLHVQSKERAQVSYATLTLHRALLRLRWPVHRQLSIGQHGPSAQDTFVKEVRNISYQDADGVL